MRINDYMFLIIRYLKTKKIRTFLTSLGITIGVATIFTLISLTSGLKHYIQSELSTFGDKVLFIYPGASVSFFGRISGTFDSKFIQDIEKMPGIERVVHAYRTTTTLEYGKEKIGAYVLVINPKYVDYLNYINYRLYKGIFIKNNNNCEVTIGYNLANSESKKINVGDYINVFNKKCKVVGILQQTGGISDYEIIFPEGEYIKLFGEIKYNYLMVFTYDYNLAYLSISNYINSIKGKTYTLVSAKTIGETANRIIGSLSLFLLVIAFISIIISAINIVNTMYTSVLERYKEIGLLKAIGMKSREVLILFLLESGFIGLIGGIFGIIFGFLLSYTSSIVLISKGYVGLKPYITLELILFSLIFPFIVGILSGTIPAIKASKIEPMVALKYE